MHCALPGWHTARFASPEEFDKYRDKYAENVALGRACTADDVAQVAVWLVEHGDMTTGEVIKVDGGAHLGPPWRKR